MQLKPRTLYRWYRDVISHYHQDKQQGRFAANKVYQYDATTGEVQKEQVVHIVKPENVGESMCIDEKMINKRYCIILSNHQTGKIALLIESMKPELIRQAIALLGKEQIQKVKRMNSDMSPTIKKICRDSIPNALIVVDKFHVIMHIMDALNTVRLTIKHQLKQSKEITTNNNPNGWTDVELLEKSRYLLYKMWGELDQDQQQIMKIVFEKHPILLQAYTLVQEIRNWYSSKNIRQHPLKLENELDNWMTKTTKSKIRPLMFIVKMLEKNKNEILRYFENGLTNAKAENLNGKIQRFVMSNYGIRDKDFFFYRVQIYFS